MNPDMAETNKEKERLTLAAIYEDAFQFTAHPDVLTTFAKLCINKNIPFGFNIYGKIEIETRYATHVFRLCMDESYQLSKCPF